jgi:ribosomal-protein-alanine N-acetyltransferase
MPSLRDWFRRGVNSRLAVWGFNCAMKVRVCRSEDLEALVALERSSPTAAHWQESFYRELFEKGAAERISLVAEDQAGLRGFLVARIAGDECELENVVVAESSQRRGLGSKLIRALIDEVSDRKIARIFLEVRESNVAARALYLLCGFAISGRRASYYSDPREDAVLYALALRSRGRG